MPWTALAHTFWSLTRIPFTQRNAVLPYWQVVGVCAEARFEELWNSTISRRIVRQWGVFVISGPFTSAIPAASRSEDARDRMLTVWNSSVKSVLLTVLLGVLYAVMVKQG